MGVYPFVSSILSQMNVCTTMPGVNALMSSMISLTPIYTHVNLHPIAAKSSGWLLGLAVELQCKQAPALRK